VPEQQHHTIGSTNGPWLILFKFMSIAVPVMCACVGWMLTEMIQLRTSMARQAEWQRHTEADRFRREDAYQQKADIEKQINDVWQAISKLPPPDVRRQLLSHEDRLDDLDVEMAKLSTATE
jgi:septal ring factor EnvC (AmiA/AmiB activator)